MSQLSPEAKAVVDDLAAKMDAEIEGILNAWVATLPPWERMPARAAWAVFKDRTPALAETVFGFIASKLNAGTEQMLEMILKQADDSLPAAQ